MFTSTVFILLFLIIITVVVTDVVVEVAVAAVTVTVAAVVAAATQVAVAMAVEVSTTNLMTADGLQRASNPQLTTSVSEQWNTLSGPTGLGASGSHSHSPSFVTESVGDTVFQRTHKKDTLPTVASVKNTTVEEQAK